MHLIFVCKFLFDQLYFFSYISLHYSIYSTVQYFVTVHYFSTYWTLFSTYWTILKNIGHIFSHIGSQIDIEIIYLFAIELLIQI